MKFIYYLAALILSVVSYGIHAKSEAINLGGYLIAEDIANFRGGLRAGSVIDGAAQITASIHTDAVGLWKDGTFMIGILGITNTNNQNLFTNAIQSVSNYYSTPELRLSEFQYSQTFSNNFSGRIGIMDVYDYFNTYRSHTLLNSGFGFCRAMNNNISPPTYPYPGFGAILEYNKQNFAAKISIFQGDPIHQVTIFRHGSLIIGEASWQNELPLPYKQNLMLKGGIWQYNQKDIPTWRTHTGLYLIAESIWNNSDKFKRSIFAQFGYAPKKYNAYPYSLCGGFTATGLLPKRCKDIFSLGISQLWIRNFAHEVVYEVTYAIFIVDNLFLNPDLQYIVKPSGYSKNALAGVLRLTYKID